METGTELSRDKEMVQLNFPSDSSVPVSTEGSHGSHTNLHASGDLSHNTAADPMLNINQNFKPQRLGKDV